jgi:hypothetical protein
MRHNSFSYLLVALLIFIVVVPVAYDLDLVSLAVSRILGISSLLAIGVWSLRGAGRLFSFGMFFVVMGIVLSLLYAVLGEELLQIAALSALFAFLLLTTVSAFKRVAISDEISANRIVGAICIYLMLGAIWSICYAMLEISAPGSFKGLTELADQGLNPDWVYFSFVTLTTLGYGDITPLTQSARTLSFAEAIVGQFYIAILVAGLVSAYISVRQESGQNN